MIPELSEIVEPHIGTSDSAMSIPDLSNSDTAIGKLEGANSSTEKQIEFLCPNGHRLHGPARLQGKPGQCPDCGSKFRVPTYDEIPDFHEAEEPLGKDIQLGRPEGKSNSDIPISSPDLSSPKPTESSLASNFLKDDVSSEDSATPHPMAQLMTTMWRQKALGANIELHLNDGTQIEPDEFLKSHSKPNYGMFEIAESESSRTLIAVSWDSISRIVAKGVPSLLDEFAD